MVKAKSIVSLSEAKDLRYMNEYDCNGAGAGSTQCTSLETQKTNLEARISENVRTARDRGCTT